jgi:hypothetical protein
VRVKDRGLAARSPKAVVGARCPARKPDNASAQQRTEPHLPLRLGQVDQTHGQRRRADGRPGPPAAEQAAKEALWLLRLRREGAAPPCCLARECLVPRAALWAVEKAAINDHGPAAALLGAVAAIAAIRFRAGGAAFGVEPAAAAGAALAAAAGLGVDRGAARGAQGAALLVPGGAGQAGGVIAGGKRGSGQGPLPPTHPSRRPRLRPAPAAVGSAATPPLPAPDVVVLWLRLPPGLLSPGQ